MTEQTRSRGSRLILLAGGLIAIGLILGSVQSHSATEAARHQLAEIEARAPPYYDDRGNMVRPAQYERNRLRSEIYKREHTAGNWLTASGVFAGVVALFGFLWILADILKRFALRLPLRNSAGVPVAEKLGSALTAAKKRLEPGPVVGLGRLSTADELRKWAELHDQGLITDEEFARMRGKLLG